MVRPCSVSQVRASVNGRSTGFSWTFRWLLADRHIPGFGAASGWLAGRPRSRRSGLVLGDASNDSSLLDGEFDEFFLGPLYRSAEHRHAAIRLQRGLDDQLIDDSAHSTVASTHRSRSCGVRTRRSSPSSGHAP